MKPSGKVEEPTWDRSYRDQTPSEADLSDYDPGFIATANLDISNRFDLTEFTRTPFTIAQGRAAKAKKKTPPPLLQPLNSKEDSKKEEKKGKSKLKTSIPGRENIQDTEDDNIKNSIEDTKEGTEDSLDKKKKKKKVKYGGYSSYAEWDAAEERADRAGGPPIAPAAIQLPPPKKEEKKRYSNNYRQAPGWLDAKGNSKAPSKPFPKTGFTTAAALAGASNQSKKRKIPATPAPSILQALDAVDKDKSKKPKTTKAADKKEPVKRGKVAAKGTKAKGKGKKDTEEAEPSLKFGRLPAGAGPTDDFPIIKGFERMKSLPTKQRPAQLDIDKLIPSTKKELEKNKKNKVPSSSKNKTFKSDEIILDDDDNESIDPPSDTDATLHASSATLKGSGKPKWFSSLFENVPQEVKLVPTPNQIRSTGSTDGIITPDAEPQCDNDDPSTMTHLSIKPHISDYATSSSQLPYSSPVAGKYGRSGRVGIINPIPVRDKSSQIAHLQKMANQGQSRQAGYDRNSFTAPMPLLRQPNPDKELISSFPEDDEVKEEEEEEWSTLKKQSRYASKSMNRKDDYPQPSSRARTALFPQQGPAQQDRKQVPVSRYSKLTVFQPPTRPAQQNTGYTIAAIPNGARKIDQQQYQVDEMQWTGTPRRNMELHNPKPKDLSYLRTAEAARPDPGEDWRNEWKGQKVKRDISNNSLGGYALKKDIKRGEVDGQGRAFRM